ncbi:MAG: hypothetical protein WC087_01070 [Candidatus Paceibacterota bacterium]
MFKKVCSKFFTILSLSLILSSVFPAEIFAQTSEVVRQETIPLVVEIHNTAYSSDKRLVSIDFSVQNNSTTFVDNLKYSFEFYNGEKLETTGLLFRNLDYIVSTSDTFPRLAPGESGRQTIQYELPPTIPGGSYFIRGTVFNEELSYYGITYTKEPLRLTGRGTFISNKQASLVDVETKNSYQLMEGPTLEKDKSYIVSFPESTNQELFDAIAREDIYSDIKISHISDNAKIVYEENNILLEDLIREDGEALEFKIDPWENILSGSHTAFISFKNARGEQISENISVRLLYRGLIGRIYETQTNINSYRKGEPISLIVNTIVAGDPMAKKATLKAIFKSKSEVIQEVEKEIDLNGTFQGTDVDVDFSDKKIKSKTLIDEIELILSDENGNILDTQVVTMDPNKIFEYPKSNLLRNLLWSLLALVVVVGLLAFLKKKTNFTLVSIAIALLFVGGTIIDSKNNLASAQEYITYWGCTDPSASNYNYQANVNDGTCLYYQDAGDSNDGNSNQTKPILYGDLIDIWSVPDGEPEGYQGLCSGENSCSDVEFYVKVSCKACGNLPVDVTVDFYNDTVDPAKTKTWNMNTTSSTSVNEWIFGPFVEEFCFDVDHPQRVETNGVLSQTYRLEARADFGGDYCRVDFEQGDSRQNLEFTDVSRSDRQMMCALDSEIQSSFYLDYSEDGLKDSDEPYIKSNNATSYCIGVEGLPLGAVQKQFSESILGGLIPQDCNSPDDIPYFFKTVDFGNYIAKLDPSNSFGWIQTGVEYFFNDAWYTEYSPGNSYFPVAAGEILKSRVGIKNLYPVTLSCAANPGVGWYIDNFYSDDHTQEELEYVWTGDVEPESGSPSSGGVIYTPPTEPPAETPKCTTPASVTITNVATTLQACYEHEKDMCGGLYYGKSYTVIGATLSLRDPCNTGELWFINTNFNGSRIRTDTRKHGDSWDAPINRSGYLSDAEDSDTVTVDGWTRSSRINQGVTRTVYDSESVSLEMCPCTACEEEFNAQGWPSSNYGKNEACQFYPPTTTVIFGCRDPLHPSYNSQATHPTYVNPYTGAYDGCDYGGGCRVSWADNFDSIAGPKYNYDDGSCVCTYDAPGESYDGEEYPCYGPEHYYPSNN